LLKIKITKRQKLHKMTLENVCFFCNAGVSSQKHSVIYTNVNKQFELMLTGRAKAYSSSNPQAVTHRSTNRAQRRVTSFQPKRVNNYATPPTLVPWRRLVNDIDLSRLKAPKIHKTPYFGFKVIQGH